MEKSLPVVVLTDVVPLPNNEFRTEIVIKSSLKAIEESEKSFGGNLILAIQKNDLSSEPTADELFEYGIIAKLAMKFKLSTSNYKIRVTGLKRVKLKEFVLTNPHFIANYEELDPIYGDMEEQNVLVNMIQKQIADGGAEFNKQNLPDKIKTETEPDVLADLVAFNLRGEKNQKLRYLEELDVNQRLKFVLEDFSKQSMIESLERKIESEVRKAIDENQKEYFLREKIKAIQNELGDRVKREEDIDELRKKILASKMPKNIEEHAMQELNRYQSSPASMPESSIIKTYLDFLVALPWDKSSVDLNDLVLVKNKLDENHYGLEGVKDRIIEYLAVKIKTGRNPQTILCLSGPPGVGKTSLAISISEALGRRFVKQSLGGVKDESEIRGHRRTYVGALPGRILKGMKDAGTINPVFLLDEIDKMASDYKGDPASAMLEVLDPEQNARFSDHYLEETYDLSQVLFITTANDLTNVPAPLRDRMEIVELSSYTEQEKFQIAKRHLIDKQLKAHGIGEKEFSISDDAIYYIIQYYTREAGVRELSRYISSLIRKAIKEILTNNSLEKVSISKENIEKYLGKPKFSHNLANDKQQIGVVTGLAYTAFGGDTLSIEVAYYPGKGRLVLTGKLGDVMKESAQTALSFVKSMANEYKIDSKLFEENDFHIHVPEGAVPKDGPSAGVTIATAIYSALLQKYVRNEVGMTGEITLRGHILPIGGLREKSIAAHRSGLKAIIIPKDNTKDIEDIPVEVQNALKIIPVDSITDVFLNALK